MLRVSATTTGTEIDLRAVVDESGGPNPGIEYGPELIEFAEAIARRDSLEIKRTRTNLNDVAGDRVVADAAGVAANFQRMVRIADSVGIPVDDMQSDLGRAVRAELALDRFPGASR